MGLLGDVLCAVLCLVTQSCPTLCNPMDCSLPGSSVHRDFPGKNTGVGCHFLLQVIFPTQGSNQGLPHCRKILYQLSYQGSPLYFGTTQIPTTPLPPRPFHLALGNSHSKIDRVSSRGTLPLSGLELNMVLPSRYHFHCTSLQ